MENRKCLKIEKGTKLEEIPELKNFNKYDAIRIEGKTLEETIEILKKYGEAVKSFYFYTGVFDEITSSNLIKILNLMPFLEDIGFVPNIIFEIEESSVELNLPHLKSVFVADESHFKFFFLKLPQNCLEAFKFYPYGNPKTSDESTVLERFKNFLSTQKSIKICKISCEMPLDALNLLTLNELVFGDFMNNRDITNVIKYQPELKKFKCEGQIDLETFVEVCQLSKLETLIVDVRLGFGSSKILENLKHLKHLELSSIWEDSQQRLLDFKLESLETLTLNFNSEILELISINFPNLKTLQLISSQNLNLFAKVLPNLEELILGFNGENICEPDTGHVNQNLKKLNLSGILESENICENILEILITFPNLESLNFKMNETYEFDIICPIYLTDKIFFVKLNEMENLKSLDLAYFTLQNRKIDLFENVEEIKKLLQKLNFARFEFLEYLNGEEKDFEDLKRNTSALYDSFADQFKEEFKVHRDDTLNNRDLSQDVCNKFNLIISNEDL